MDWNINPIETAAFYGLDLITGLQHFKRGCWITVKGAESYMNETNSAFECFCAQAAKGKIDPNYILKKIAPESVLHNIEIMSLPDIFH